MSSFGSGADNPPSGRKYDSDILLNSNRYQSRTPSPVPWAGGIEDTSSLDNSLSASRSSSRPASRSASSRSVLAARNAFFAGDNEKSKELHNLLSQRRKESEESPHSERHVHLGELIKSIVFGGLDGIVTTFAVVAACVGSQQTFATTLIVGVANAIGDAFGMGLGDFFSSRAQALRSKKLFKDYTSKVKNKPEEAKRAMRGLFLRKGFSHHESRKIVEFLSQNQDAFVDILLLELEGVSSDESTIWSPLKGGVVTFLSFMLFGSIPLLPFVMRKDFSVPSRVLDWHFYLACGLTGMALFLLGVVRNALLHKSWILGGIVILVQGGISTLAAFGAGYFIEKLSQLL